MSGIFLKYTWKTLKENRSRTLVTIVGIVLSVALLAAVTVSLSSAMEYMERVAINRQGNWSIDIFTATEKEMESMLADDRVQGYTALQNLGYALIGSTNEYKPYLYIGGMDEYLTEQMPIHILEGRLPENETELLIPAHLEENGGVSLEVGQTVTLELGQRWLESGEAHLAQDCGFISGEGHPNQEQFVPDGREVTYTVVGIYERPVFEGRSAPGYTALTIPAKDSADWIDDDNNDDDADADAQRVLAEPVWELWIRLDDLTREAQEAFIREHAPHMNPGTGWTDNHVLQRYTVASGSDVVGLLYVMGVILMILVVAGSVALIYNAFSISVTERIRQFGLLRSLGATRRQIMGSVLWEGLLLCVAAIPIGFVVGCLGIAATVWACRDLFMTVIKRFSEDTMFMIRVSWWSMALTVGLGIVTVLISAWIPASRALRIHPIEAIRQSQEIRLAAGNGDSEYVNRAVNRGRRQWRQLSNCLTAKFFGMEGLLASKNFRRSRRRYRSTIVSLSFSVILFISANTFCHYLVVTVENGVGSERYDLSYYMNPDVPRREAQETYEEMKALQGVDDSGLVINVPRMAMSVDPEDMSRDYRKYWEKEDGRPWQHCSVHLIEDGTYRAYLEEEGLDVERYMDSEEPLALVYDRVRIYNPEDGSAQMYLALKDDTEQLELWITKDAEGYYGSLAETAQGSQVRMYRVNEDGTTATDVPGEEQEYYVSLEEGVRRETLQIGQILEEIPWFAGGLNWINIFLPESAGETLGLTERAGSYTIVLMDEDYEPVYDGMEEIFNRRTNGILQNHVGDARDVRALMTLIQVFSGGFLVLISLITAANIFNTISTNVLLRRREFAMLKSIGMTERGLQRILGYECLMYGGKSLLWALPISIGITWQIYDRVRVSGYFTGYYIPWSVLLIAVGAVFVIVSATMVYSRRKLKLGTLTDALRSENA